MPCSQAISSLAMKKNTGLIRILKAVGYSCQGLRDAWRGEAAFRQELILLLLATCLAFWFNVSVVERILLIGSVMLVLIVEVLNSALESVVDRMGTERHELSRQAKDLASAAVLLTFILAAFVWIMIVGYSVL